MSQWVEGGDMEILINTAAERDRLISLLHENRFIVHFVTAHTPTKEEWERLAAIMEEEGFDYNQMCNDGNEYFTRRIQRAYWNQEKVAV